MRGMAKAVIGYSVLFGAVVGVVAFRHNLFPPPVHPLAAQAMAPIDANQQGVDIRRVIAASVRH